MSLIDMMQCDDCRHTATSIQRGQLTCPWCRSDQFDFVDSRPCYARTHHEPENKDTLLRIWQEDKRLMQERARRIDFYRKLEHIVRTGRTLDEA